jgi:ribosomal protein S24E
MYKFTHFSQNLRHAKKKKPNKPDIRGILLKILRVQQEALATFQTLMNILSDCVTL